MNWPWSILFASPHQRTPLHRSAVGGHVDTVNFLVQKGANIDSKNDVGVSEWEYTTDCGLVLLIRVSLVPMRLTRVWYALLQLITSILSEIEITNWSAWTSDKQIQLVHLLVCTASVTAPYSRVFMKVCSSCLHCCYYEASNCHFQWANFIASCILNWQAWMVDQVQIYLVISVCTNEESDKNDVL